MLSVEGWWSAGVDLRLRQVQHCQRNDVQGNSNFRVSTHRKQSGQGARRGVRVGVVFRPATLVVGFVGPEPNSSCDLRM